MLQSKDIEWQTGLRKQEPTIWYLQETHLRAKDTHRLKVRGWKKVVHANRNDKRLGVAMLISDKIDFKTKAIKKDKEGHYIMIKASIQEEDFTLISIYAPNIGAPKYIKWILTDIKGETDGNTIIVGDFNAPLTSMDRSSKQSISKATDNPKWYNRTVRLSWYVQDITSKKTENTHSFQVHL